MKYLSLAIAIIVFVFSTSYSQQKGNAVNAEDASNSTIYGVRQASNLVYANAGNNTYNNAYQNQGQRTTTQFLNDTIMMVTITGLYNVKSDAYVVQFALSQNGTTIDSASGFINDRLKRFTDQLKKLGIKQGDISIDQISQVPTYEYSVEKKLFSRTYNEIPSGFEIKKNIIIGYTDPDMLDDIMTAAAKSEIYDVVKVDYNINDVAGKYNQLRKDCLKQIKEKIDDFGLMGLKFVPLQQTFNEASQVFYPSQRYSQYSAYNNASVQIANTKLDKDSKVNVVAKPVTYYYDKVPYNQFDVVINPNMIEPSAQFTYTVSVKYVMKGPERPVGLTAPAVAKLDPKRHPGKEIKMKLPNSVNFKFDVDGDENE